MKIKYEIYSCNNGNPTAIIKNELLREQSIIAADRIYEANPEIDQVAMILNINKNECTFRLVGGEFCGNACLTVGGFMKKNHGIEKGYIINNIDDIDNTVKSLKIKSTWVGQKCSLRIPKEALIVDDGIIENEHYFIKMNGISHIIIPNSFGEKNKQIAENEKSKFEKLREMPDVLGIIFLDKNRIDPFIWINKISIFQNQTSCLSGSIAAAKYLMAINNIDSVDIEQPTGEAYKIAIDDKEINVSGNVKCIGAGKVNID